MPNDADTQNGKNTLAASPRTSVATRQDTNGNEAVCVCLLEQVTAITGRREKAGRCVCRTRAKMPRRGHKGTFHPAAAIPPDSMVPFGLD